MYQILIVDEEEHLLWALEKNLLPERDNIKIITANGGEQGLELLRNENIDVLICDIKMPGKVDGFQLILRAKEVAPDARVVIMTAFGTNRIQNLAERIGITHYIEKPFNISDLRNVVLELLDAKEGFQGVLSDLELTDIIQMLCLAKRTALLHLKHRDHRGKIFFERGDVTHAEFDDQQGPDAVYEMLVLRQGDIYMQSDFHNDKRTIQVGWQDLLLEGMKRADEHRAEMGLEVSSAAETTMEGSEISEVYEDSGEITLGMPPRLVSEVDEGLGGETSGSFFTEEELEEIENANSDSLTGTANGFDRILDSGVRDLIESHEAELDGKAPERTESVSASASSEASGGEFEPPAPGRPTESADYPVHPRSAPPEAPTTEPRVVAEEVGAPRMSGGWASVDSTAEGDPAPAPPTNGSGGPAQPAPAAPMQPRAGRAEAPTVMLESLGIVSVRGILEAFARECVGISITGLFSFEDGLALEFFRAPGVTYEEDVLAAFFRDVAASADQAAGGLGGAPEFQELQIQLERELVLLRRVPETPYVHIALMGKDVRLGIAIVLMRRFGAQLAECFVAP